MQQISWPRAVVYLALVGVSAFLVWAGKAHVELLFAPLSAALLPSIRRSR